MTEMRYTCDLPVPVRVKASAIRKDGFLVVPDPGGYQGMNGKVGIL